MVNWSNVGLRRGQELEAGEGTAPTLKDLPPMVPEVEDKEGSSSSKLSTKEGPQPTSPGSAKGLTTLGGNILDASMGKAISASSVQESTPTQVKSETFVVELTQDQSSEAVTGEVTLDQTISEAATLDQTTLEATEGSMPNQTTSEEAVEGAKLIQTHPASCTDNQTPPSSPVPGATPQISPRKLTGILGTLELDKAQVRPTTTPHPVR